MTPAEPQSLSTSEGGDAASIRGAVMWMTGTLLSFLAMAIAARELSDTLSPFQIVFLRTSVGLAIVLVIGARMGRVRLHSGRPGLHFMRNVANYGANLLWIAGVGLIPLAMVFALDFTVPIWLAVIAVIFLKEKMSLGKLVVILLGFAGVLIILRPGLVDIEEGSLIVLTAAVIFAVSNAMTKSLSGTDSSMTIVFYMFAIQWPMGLIPAALVWVTPAWGDLPWILVIGLTAVTAHYCMSQALSLADATLVIPIDFLRLPMIAVIGIVFYGEPFSAYILLGAILMLAGNFYNIRAESRAAQTGS